MPGATVTGSVQCSRMHQVTTERASPGLGVGTSPIKLRLVFGAAYFPGLGRQEEPGPSLDSTTSESAITQAAGPLYYPPACCPLRGCQCLGFSSSIFLRACGWRRLPMHVQEARASATPTRVHPLGPPTPSRNMILDSLPCNFELEHRQVRCRWLEGP